MSRLGSGVEVGIDVGVTDIKIDSITVSVALIVVTLPGSDSINVEMIEIVDIVAAGAGRPAPADEEKMLGVVIGTSDVIVRTEVATGVVFDELPPILRYLCHEMSSP